LNPARFWQSARHPAYHIHAMTRMRVYFPVLLASTSLLTSVALFAVWPDWRGRNEPLHSAMEALGALAAIAMARVLYQRGDGENGTSYQGLALGFLGMGILEAFHAVAPMGNGFILLRGISSLIGGLG